MSDTGSTHWASSCLFAICIVTIQLDFCLANKEERKDIYSLESLKHNYLYFIHISNILPQTETKPPTIGKIVSVLASSVQYSRSCKSIETVKLCICCFFRRPTRSIGRKERKTGIASKSGYCLSIKDGSCY